MAGKWYEQLGKVGGAAAQGYSAAGGIGAGIGAGAGIVGSLIKKKKKNNLTGLGVEAQGSDPGGEVSNEPYVYGQEDW